MFDANCNDKDICSLVGLFPIRVPFVINMVEHSECTEVIKSEGKVQDGSILCTSNSFNFKYALSHMFLKKDDSSYFQKYIILKVNSVCLLNLLV